MLRLLKGFFALIGVLALAALAGFWLLGIYLKSGDDIKVIETFNAPDGAHTATLYSGMGGGAAGWCTHNISIYPKAAPFSPASEQGSADNRVYTGSCRTVPEVTWISPSQLQITVPFAVQPEWASVKAKAGGVIVVFKFAPNNALQSDVARPAGARRG